MRSSAAFLLAGLCVACESPPSLEESQEAITYDPACRYASVKLYPQGFFGGTPRCYYGVGTIMLPRGFHIASYRSDYTTGCFDDNVCVLPDFQWFSAVQIPPIWVTQASTLTITGWFDVAEPPPPGTGFEPGP